MLLTEVITTIIQVTGTVVTIVTTIITTQKGKSYFFMIVYVNALPSPLYFLLRFPVSK